MPISSGDSLMKRACCATMVAVFGWVLLSANAEMVCAQEEGKPAEKKNEGDEKPKDGEEKKEGDGDKKEYPKSIKRPTESKTEADPTELTIKPGADGRLQFSFTGQPWPAVLRWLAETSGHSLDWQELPADLVNLTSQKRHTPTETRDLLNRMLLDRGYTMVLQGQVMSIFNIEKMEPSLLPRVDEAELHDLSPYDFAKIIFTLPDELKADQAAKDIKPLLSPHAKVQPLVSTNRLLVIGAVVNLRAVSSLVNAEHAAATGHIVPREFLIQHNRAEYVADQVMILLGLDPASRRTPQELQLEQQKLQLFQQMQQKGKDVSKFLRKDGPSIFITVNHRRNSILVNAPKAEMLVIERAVRSLDLAPQDAVAGQSFPGAANRIVGGKPTMKRYSLVTLKPESVISALEEIGELEPRTRLNMDSSAKTIFAFATPNDHEKIHSIIDSLDGTGRQFEVIWLKSVPAAAMAETIHTLMVGKEEDDGNRGYYYYRNRNEEEKPNKDFRVNADVERNRLLLWANESEMKEVHKFLVKMGEVPGGEGNPHTVRVLDPRGAEATMRILEQIRRAWPSIGPNELRIEGIEQLRPKESDVDEDSEIPAEAKKVNPKESQLGGSPLRKTHPDRQPSTLTHMVQLSGDGGTSPSQQSNQGDTPGLPPVTISVSEDGRILLSSKDTDALDRLERLLAQVAPPAKDYEVFYLRNAFAISVVGNLKEFFEEEAEFNTQDNWWRAWYGEPFQDSGDKGIGLGKQRKIRFISDLDTNSVLVSNASPVQLETVKQLISVYDKPPSEDSISARRFSIFKLKYANAEQVAKTVKEVYRDLLSSKDKEFSKNGKSEEKSQATTNYVRVYGGMGGSDDESKGTKVRQSFAGALSVGIDEVTNTVIVSAQEEWMGSISDVIKYLDTQTEPHQSTVSYGRMAGFRGQALQAVLNGMLADQGGKQSKPTNGQNGQQPEGDQRGGAPNGNPTQQQQQ